MTNIPDETNPIACRNPTITLGNGNNNCANNSRTYNTYNDCQLSVADEKGQILEWLSPLTPGEKHRLISVDRVDGVGDWRLHTTEFMEWHRNEDQTVNSVLFCYGDPGVGKTYLCSLVIDKLCDPSYKREEVVVACVYCDYRAHEKQSATSVLEAVLRQVVGGLEDVPEDIKKAFERARKQGNGSRLRLPELRDMLIKSLCSLRQSFVCIDALDEFPPKHRPELWETLEHIVRECPNTRLFLTGRPHIRGECLGYFPQCNTIPIKPSNKDIENYIIIRLKRDPDPDVMDEELVDDILKIVPERVSERFILVSPIMDAILEQATRHQRKETLETMTKGSGLDDAYKTTIDRIKNQKGNRGKIGMEALMWISHSQRPLRADELCHALAVDVEKPDFNHHNVPQQRVLLACTLGLVAIDQQTSIVRLVHFTLQEYLTENPIKTAHSTIAEKCLTYLNTFPGSTPAAALHTTRTKPFLGYASRYWGSHADKRPTEVVRSLALRLLKQYPDHISATILLCETISGPLAGFTGLHCMAYLGIFGIAKTLVEMGDWDLNERDSTGATPLMWAAKYKNYAVAKLLLEQEDIKPDLSDNDDLTPLSWAARSGDEALAKLLMAREDVNPGLSDKNGRAPLLWAARSGHEGVVRLLLEQEGLNPDTPDHGGQTALSLAAEEGHEGVVRILLEREDINPDSLDKNGRTPISFAASSRNDGALKLLLKRKKVDPASSNNNGRTPLSFAASSGNEGAVTLLLKQRGVNPDSSDSYGQTPLLWAARSGNESIVKLLLERHDVNPDTSNSDGQTPLLWAARSGHEAIVKLLLERHDVNPDPSDNNGRTPLFFAARSGYEGIVSIFLKHEDVNPNALDKIGRTPLAQAAMRGHKSVVNMLLERGDVNPDLPDIDNQTPLSLAAMTGHEGIVGLLLQQKKLNPHH